jgi:hypothetical protein
MTVWVDIIKKALSNIIESTGKAVPGAKLRSEVAKVAADWGVAFPPDEMTRFSSFVESFENDFIVLRRPGSDVLVAPADRAELFAASATAPNINYSRMRQDIFEAITTILPTERGVPYYAPEDDSVSWVKQDEKPSKETIVFPTTTLEEEVALRKEFSDQVDSPGTAKEEIAKALDSSAPLRGFTEVTHAHGLNKQWHFFRLRSLSAKLRDWSVRNAVSWQVGWVNIREPKTVAASPQLQTASSRTHLAEILSRVSEEDLSRIVVPLDVVLKIWAHR